MLAASQTPRAPDGEREARRALALLQRLLHWGALGSGEQEALGADLVTQSAEEF